MTPSPWVVRWAPLILQGGRVLDLASGGGRHARYLAGLGLQVVAVDRDPTAGEALAGVPGVAWHQADLEDGSWPYGGESFDAIVVSRYLHRPLFPVLLDALAPGGLLIYETFALGQERYGRPRNPAHLLLPGELLELVRGRLGVLGYEDVLEEGPPPRRMQRLCGQRP